MSESIVLNGKCLCKAISVRASVPGLKVGACHCSFCRTWGGGPLLTIECGDDVDLSNHASLVVYNSSDWAERGFCSSCGTHLFYRLKENQHYTMPIGLFDEPAGLEFDHQIFIDEQPEYYEFANETEKLTGSEVFAKFAAEQES